MGFRFNKQRVAKAEQEVFTHSDKPSFARVWRAGRLGEAARSAGGIGNAHRCFGAYDLHDGADDGARREILARAPPRTGEDGVVEDVPRLRRFSQSFGNLPPIEEEIY